MTDMKALTIRDPKTQEMKPVLLQVIDKDEQGPITLRVRYDHERIDLSNERDRTFVVMYAPVHSVLGEMQLSDLYADLQKVKDELEAMGHTITDTKRALDAAKRDLTAMDAENKQKTESLRVLQKERDPDRLEAMVAARTLALEEKIVQANGETALCRQEIAELRASKKRLKEANQRLLDEKARR